MIHTPAGENLFLSAIHTPAGENLFLSVIHTPEGENRFLSVIHTPEGENRFLSALLALSLSPTRPLSLMLLVRSKDHLLDKS